MENIVEFKTKEQRQVERIQKAVERINNLIAETKEEILTRETPLDPEARYLKTQKMLEMIRKENNRRVTEDLQLNRKKDTKNGA